jgi:Transcriptional regulator, AbiEi antitoxin, Type IV TA system
LTFHRFSDIQHSMKSLDPVKFEEDARAALEAFLRELPRTRIDSIWRPAQADIEDILADFHIDQQRMRLFCEVKTSGQPRFVRGALDQLSRIPLDRHSAAIVIAPYLSEQSRALCRNEGKGYFDLEGNVLISAGSVHIERTSPTQPKAEKRSLRSLFKPKSARILRTLLRDPSRPWRIVELAESAGVSVGHVSTISNELKDRAWVQQRENGFVLSDPDDLLDAWAAEYQPPSGDEHALYTHLHGSALDEALRQVMTGPFSQRFALRSYSAADQLAPFARNANRYLYADDKGLDQLTRQLRLSAAGKGGNILVLVPDEDGVFDDAVTAGTGFPCTSAVQTYLDLQRSGERGREAADHLRRELLRWR